MKSIGKYIITASVFTLIILFFISCWGKSSDIQRHTFLLDKIGDVEIVKTPDLKKIKLDRVLKQIIGNRSSDINLPSSPLIKKIKCLTETRNALFAPADSIYDFPVTIKKGAVLSFGAAIDDRYLEERRVPVEFNLFIKKKQDKTFHLLHNERFFPGSPGAMGWHDHTVDLNEYEGEAILRLETKKHIEQTRLEDDLFAYWSSPVITHRPAGREKKTKLILISLDTLRADHLELYGYKRQTAPGMTRRSSDFVVFKNCWSQWCWTHESHQSIMTGLYEAEHMVPEFYRATPGHLVTLAEIMKTSGYITAAFTGAGKVGAHTGLCKGFDSYFDNEYRKDGGFELLGTWLRTRRWLKENAGNDFFLFFHTYQIHAPYRTFVPRYDDMFKTHDGDNNYIFSVKQELVGNGLDKVDWFWRKIKQGKITGADSDVIQGYRDYYDGSIRYTDEYCLEEFFACLKELGIYDQSLIVILSDHGEEFFEHGRFKHFDGLYEEYIHVPLMIKFPYSRFGGTVREENVETVDVFPTLMEALGIPLKHPVSGRTLMRTIARGNNPGPQRENYIFSQSSAKYAVKKGKTKLLLRARVDRKLRQKIPRIEIFDLARDPGERHPVKIDDLSGHAGMYDAVYKRLISKKRGIHIVFPGKLSGKTVEGEIVIPGGGAEIKTFYEAGVTGGDFSRLRKNGTLLVFKWKMTGWKKSLILVPRRDKLRISIRLSIDGQEKELSEFFIDGTLERDGEFLQLSGRRYKPVKGISEPLVLIFGNGISKKGRPGKYFPGVSKNNLEKLKALGYIN
jgi:arylsulfatase A-like enzyme